MRRHSLFIFIVLPCLAALAVLAVALLAHYVSGAEFPVLDPKGPVALAERHLIFITAALCMIVVVPTFFTLFFFAWRYRADGPHAHDGHETNWDHDSAGAEFFWWLVPSAIILALAIISWDSSHALDPFRPLTSNESPLTIEVVALQWKWLFIYPAQGVATVNDLVLPAGHPVTFKLTADAPMNSFWIPALGGQIMVMPGMVTQLNLLASTPGTFDGYSANISGEGFARMAFKARAVAPEEFDAWTQDARDSLPLSAEGYRALAQPGVMGPTAYSIATTTLFDSVVYSTMGMSGMGIPSSGMGTMTMP